MIGKIRNLSMAGLSLTELKFMLVKSNFTVNNVLDDDEKQHVF